MNFYFSTEDTGYLTCKRNFIDIVSGTNSLAIFKSFTVTGIKLPKK